MARSICAEAVSLIKHFEGLMLSAYPDPGTGDKPYTIGYGHAGPDVHLGDTITEDEAEELLRHDLIRFEQGVNDLLPGLSYHEFCACVSWAFNVGLGAVESSTLRKRILAGEDPQIVIAEELPRWNKGGSGVMPGLSRRRAAEVEHAMLDAQGGAEAPGEKPEAPDTTEPEEDAHSGTQIALIDFFRYFSDTDWQRSAVEILEEALANDAPYLLENGAEWVEEYRSAPEPESIDNPFVVRLEVPYLYQYDSEVDGQAGRMCFSSSNAMLVEYLLPGSLKGAGQADDIYLDQVLEFGDTTSAEAQVAALGDYGIEAVFRTDGTTALVRGLLQSGVPVPIGVLHYGPVSAPSGGGHWLVLVGYDDLSSEWICHDPAGEMDVVNGGYVRSGPTDGRYVRYSYQNLGSRWMVGGEGDGWLIEALT